MRLFKSNVNYKMNETIKNMLTNERKGRIIMKNIFFKQLLRETTRYLEAKTI